MDKWMSKNILIFNTTKFFIYKTHHHDIRLQHSFTNDNISKYSLPLRPLSDNAFIVQTKTEVLGRFGLNRSYMMNYGIIIPMWIITVFTDNFKKDTLYYVHLNTRNNILTYRIFHQPFSMFHRLD